MESLRDLCFRLGYTRVATYIQSGNLIFTSSVNNTEQISSELHDLIQNSLGFDVVVLSFTICEFENIINYNPFQIDKEIPYLHVSFLSKMLADIDTEFFNRKKDKQEEIAYGARQIYLYCPNGYGTTKLTNKLFESKLKTFATTRNWNTCCELLKMARTLE